MTAAHQNHRSGHASLERVFTELLMRGRATPDVLYGFATVRNQRGRHAEVTVEDAILRSTDPLVRFELARAQFLNGNATAAMSILRDAVTHDAGAAILFAHFSHPALSLDARTMVTSVPFDNLGARLLEEWERAAWSSGLGVEERLMIHFRRVAHADSLYVGLGRATGDSLEVITSGRREPDPRREIHIRFGEARQVVHTPIVTRTGGFSADFETWAFADPYSRELMLFHFSGANANYTLVVGASCNENWLSDRATLTPLIGALYTACRSRAPDRTARIGNFARQTQASYSRNRYREFVVPARAGMQFAYRLYTFENPDRTLEVAAVAVVPMDEIPERAEMRAGLFLHDGDGGIRSSTVEHRMSRPGNATIVLAIDRVQPGDYSYRLRVSDRDFGTGFVYGGEHEAQLGGSASLRMSDLVIAHAEDDGPLRRGSQSLHPIPGAVPGADFDLYGEAYGIARGERIDVEIGVSRRGGLLRRRGVFELKFSTTSDDDHVFAFRQRIQHGLDAGTYDLNVRIRSAVAGVVERSTRIEIR